MKRMYAQSNAFQNQAFSKRLLVSRHQIRQDLIVSVSFGVRGFYTGYSFFSLAFFLSFFPRKQLPKNSQVKEKREKKIATNCVQCEVSSL